MTITHRTGDVIPGVARYGTGTVTFGTYTDGGDVTLQLTDGQRARHAVITGACGSGKTSLLESLLDGARLAGIQVSLISPHHGNPSATVSNVAAAVAERTTSGWTWPLQILLIDDLPGHDDSTLTVLADIATTAGKANVALVMASQSVRQADRGGSVIRQLTDPALIEFAGDSATPGVGTVNGDLFRAWWPSA